MKILFITLSSLTLGLAIYQLIQGDSFMNQIAFLIIGVVMIWTAFTKTKNSTCQESNKS